jgi:hypothetical protein
MENLHLKVEKLEGNELVVRMGKARDLKDPVPVKFDGTIDALLSFYDKRKEQLNALNSRVEYTLEAPYNVKLIINDKDFFKDEIVGSMSFHKEFEGLKINTETKKSGEELAKYLRLRLHLFEDPSEGLALINALRNLKANISSNTETKKDDRGNRVSNFDKTVKLADGFPELIKMNMPIFKGMPSVSFFVNLGIDSSDSQTVFYLYSIDLPKIINDTVIQEIDRALKVLEVLPCMEY